MWAPLLAVAAAFLAAAPPALAQGMPPAKVAFDEVRQETVEQWRDVTGELRPVRRSVLAAEEEGLVMQIDLDAGDRVEKDQVVARLDAELAELDVRRAEAEVARRTAQIAVRRAELADAERNLNQRLEAQRRNAASETEIEDARTGVQAATARIEEAEADKLGAEAELLSAQRRLGNMTIRAPFSGRIVRKRTEIGQWASRGQAIVELVELERIEAWIDVPESYLERLTSSTELGESAEQADLPVQIRVVAINEVLEGTIAGVVPEADPLARLFPVRVALNNESERLRPGMSVVGLVPTGTRAASVTVHKDAIRRNDAGTFVFYDAGGSAAVAPVTILFASGDRVAVRSPVLQPGMRVVIEGNERLIPGQPLTDVDAPRPGRESGDSGGTAGRGEANAGGGGR